MLTIWQYAVICAANQMELEEQPGWQYAVEWRDRIAVALADVDITTQPEAWLLRYRQYARPPRTQGGFRC